MTLKDCVAFYKAHPNVLKLVLEDADALSITPQVFLGHEDAELEAFDEMGVE